MYSEEELIKIIKKNGLDCYSLLSENVNILTIDADFNEILKFAKKRNINELFYTFCYSSEDVLTITEETVKKTMEKVDVPYKEIYDIITPMVQAYNNKVSKLDFSRPHSLTVFCLYQGQRIGIFETDLWFLDEGAMLPEEELNLIINENKELIKKRLLEKEEQSDEIREEFHKYLLNDEKFHKCTNASLRTTYTMQLYKDAEHQNFKNAFIKGTDYQRYNQYAEFIDSVWREYKEVLKKKKHSLYLNDSEAD